VLGQKSSQEADICSRRGIRAAAHLGELQQQRGALEVELAQKQMALQNLRDRIQENIRSIWTRCSECITITIATKASRIQTLTRRNGGSGAARLEA